jgi:hypothetical protein
VTAISVLVSLGLSVLPVAIFALAAAPPDGRPGSARWGDLEIAPPVTRGSLSVYLLLADSVAVAKPDREILTIEEALAKGLARIHETSDVNRLEVENLSRSDVFIQMGDVIKGGRQDRMFTTDILLGPESGRVAAAVNCVEQGRWSRRGAEDPTQFASAATMAPARAMRLPASMPVSAAENQGAVWGAVAGLQSRLEEVVAAPLRVESSPSSLQLTLENEALQGAIAATEKAVAGAAAGQPRAVGYVYAVGSEIYGAEVYASHGLLVKLWPKLVRAMAVEAVAADAPRGDAPTPVATARTLAAADDVRGRAVESEAGRARVRRVDGERFVASETTDAGNRVIHKMVLAKD